MQIDANPDHTYRNADQPTESIVVGDANPFNRSSAASRGGATLVITHSPDTSAVSCGSLFPLIFSIAVLLELSSRELGYSRCRRQDDGSEPRCLLLEVFRVPCGFFSFS